MRRLDPRFEGFGRCKRRNLSICSDSTDLSSHVALGIVARGAQRTGQPCALLWVED